MPGDPDGRYYCSTNLHLNFSYEHITQAVSAFSPEESRYKVDFPHMMVTMAGMLAADAGEDMTIANAVTFTYCGYVPELSNEKLRESLVGWLGDAVLSGGKFGTGDYGADLDAVNLVAMIRSGDNLPYAILRYYRTDIGANGKNREALFLQNVGLTVEQIIDVILRVGGCYDSRLSYDEKELLIQKKFQSAYSEFIVPLKNRYL